MQRLLDYPSVTPTPDECQTPDARASTHSELQRAITWDKPFREKLHARLKARSLEPEDSRNDALAALDDNSIDGWRIRWVFAEQGGKLVARSVQVEADGAATPSGGLDANLLRRLSPASAARSAAILRSEAPDGSAEQLFLKWAARDAATTNEPRKQGRPELSDPFLAAVSIAYLRELPRGRGVLHRVGLSVAPVAYGAHGVPDETVRDWVHKARVRGFLGPAPKRGASGGVAGPRLKQLLEEGMRVDDGNE